MIDQLPAFGLLHAIPGGIVGLAARQGPVRGPIAETGNSPNVG
jgi:hypothetical protein